MPDEPEARTSSVGPPLRANLLFVLPCLLLLALFIVLPLLIGTAISFQDYDMRAGSNGWVGIDNFRKLLHDDAFPRAVAHTLLFVAITVPASVLLGLGLALALNNPRRGSAFFRPLFFAFAVITVSVVTMAWRAMLLPGGLAHSVERFFGVPAFDPSHGPAAAAIAPIAVATIWWLVGVPMMLFCAALDRVPADVYDAARLDNVGRLRTFLFVTLPSVRRTFLLAVVIEIVLQVQVFGQTLLIGADGPAAQSMAQFIYDAAFRDQQFGLGSAAAQFLLGIVAIFALAQLWLSRRWRTGI
jgi:multiple sugar transport system permease protein